MIGYIVLFFVFMFVLTMFLVRDKLSQKTIIAYLSWWTLWLVVSTFNPFGMFPVTNKVYWLLLLNVFMFALGYMLYGKFRKRRKEKWLEQGTFKRTVLNNNVLKLVLIIFLAASSYLFFKYITIVNLAGAAGGRTTVFDVGELFVNKYEIYFYNLAIKPFADLLAVVFICLLLFKRKPVMLTLCSAFIFLYGAIGSGRLFYISIVIFLGYVLYIKEQILSMRVFDFLPAKKTPSEELKRKVILVILVVLLVFLMAFITAQRMEYSGSSIKLLLSGGREFFKQSVWYMTGSFRALDFALTKDYAGMTGYFNGRATFAGFDDLVKIIIHGFGGAHESANDVIIPMIQETLLISPEIHYNFAYTNVLVHYLDFGVWGVALFPFLFGLFSRSMCFKFKETPTFPMLVLIVCLFYSMIITVFKWPYQFSNAVIVMMVLYAWHWITIRKNIRKGKIVSRCLQPLERRG